MAIFQQAYKTYTGPTTSLNHRVWVICRFGLEETFRIKWFLPFFMACFIPSILMLCTIYIRYNLETIEKLRIPLETLAVIDAEFLAEWMQLPQIQIISLMVLVAGPALLSPDLRNNALPLYFSRPVSKRNYILGKLLVLIILCSLISIVPGMLLIMFQAYLAHDGWLAENSGVLVGAFFVPLIWTICMSMLCFAITTVVKIKLSARLTLFGYMMVSSAFSNVTYELFGSWSGGLFNLQIPIGAVIKWLYQVQLSDFHFGSLGMPLGVAIATLIVATSFFIYVVYRRVRAYEVVT